jgi:hypothetical protein
MVDHIAKLIAFMAITGLLLTGCNTSTNTPASGTSTKTLKVVIGGTTYAFTDSNPDKSWTASSGMYTATFQDSTGYPDLAITVSTSATAVILYTSSTKHGDYSIATGTATIANGTVSAISWTGSQSPYSYDNVTFTASTKITSITYQ